MTSVKVPVLPMVIGLAGGAILGYGKQFLETKGVLTTKLDPKPEALQIDAYMFELFVELSNFSDLDPQAFGKALGYADRMLLLEKLLHEKKTYPMPGDKTRMYTCRKRMCIELQVMMTKCTDARRLSLLNRVVYRILDRINQHYNSISTLCERLCAEDVLMDQPTT